MDVKIDVSELTRFSAKFGARGKAIAGEEVARSMDLAGALIKRSAALNAPVGVSGILRRSIGWSGTGSGFGRSVAVGTPIEYAIPIELGVRPGRHPGLSRRGLEAVTLWFRRKAGMDDKRARTAAGAFSNRLRRKGHEKRPFLTPAFDDNLSAIGAIFNKGSERAIKRMAQLGRRR